MDKNTIVIGPCKCGGYGQVYSEEAQKVTGKCHDDLKGSHASTSLFEDTGATFSPCRRYRYRLWRIWDESARKAVFVMLNPSTADEVENDPTVERCERRAREMGFGGLVVVNLFALRSTDPEALYGHPDPVGPDNDIVIIRAAQAAGIVICAWGGHGKLNGRDEHVKQMLRRIGAPLHYLKLNKDGSPGHPLYIGYDVKPKGWDI